jgi:RNA polymerase sigma-70 factor (ECF subfamily)
MLGEPSDAELLARWAEGSRAAGNELIERHFAVVHRFFRNKVGPELEDLIQQTFLGCVEARSRFEGRSSFVTFLLGIARFQLFSHYNQRRREACNFELSSIRDFGTTPSAMVARREDERLMAVALQSLPLQTQLLLELVYWENLAANEVAEVLEVPLNIVYSRLGRAREALREQLEQLAPDRMEVGRALQLLEEPAKNRARND